MDATTLADALRLRFPTGSEWVRQALAGMGDLVDGDTIVHAVDTGWMLMGFDDEERLIDTLFVVTESQLAFGQIHNAPGAPRWIPLRSIKNLDELLGRPYPLHTVEVTLEGGLALTVGWSFPFAEAVVAVLNAVFEREEREERSPLEHDGQPLVPDRLPDHIHETAAVFVEPTVVGLPEATLPHREVGGTEGVPDWDTLAPFDAGSAESASEPGSEGDAVGAIVDGGVVLDGAVPDGAVPDGAVPDGAVPDGAVPDDATEEVFDHDALFAPPTEWEPQSWNEEPAPTGPASDPEAAVAEWRATPTNANDATTAWPDPLDGVTYLSGFPAAPRKRKNLVVSFGPEGLTVGGAKGSSWGFTIGWADIASIEVQGSDEIRLTANHRIDANSTALVVTTKKGASIVFDVRLRRPHTVRAALAPVLLIASS